MISKKLHLVALKSSKDTTPLGSHIVSLILINSLRTPKEQLGVPLLRSKIK